jgi:hypothetical protein
MAQIMAVTGHKSASSVAVYQRVSSKEKQVIGDIIMLNCSGVCDGINWNHKINHHNLHPKCQRRP